VDDWTEKIMVRLEVKFEENLHNHHRYKVVIDLGSQALCSATYFLDGQIQRMVYLLVLID